MSYIWNHSPQLSAAPVEKLWKKLYNNKGKIDEYGLFLLENDKYACLHFCGVENDAEVGMTEVYEFDTQELAENFCEENFPEFSCSSCIGDGREGSGCGYVGANLSGFCPDCNGMLLSFEGQREARRLEEKWRED